MSQVAVLLTCFNRREDTLKCLATLTRGGDLGGMDLEVFVVDDGSTDGTAEVVRAAFPAVHVVPGTGSLYWTGGMHLADSVAWESRPDFLLWLNDDVQLDGGALLTLLDAAEQTGNGSIVVGAVRDPIDRTTAYGAYIRSNRRRPLEMTRLDPDGTIQSADTMNGNVVLVPRRVREAVGSLDLRFSHNMADMDYALRARAAGFGVVLAPVSVGTCRSNPDKARWKDAAVPIRERLQLIRSFRGLPPREWLAFTRRYCGWRWPRYFVSPYVRVLLAGLLSRGSHSGGH